MSSKEVCTNCQSTNTKYSIHEAYYVPVRFCNDCQKFYNLPTDTKYIKSDNK